MSHAITSVKIVKEGHVHEDKPCKVGTVIQDLSPRTTAMLIKLGVAEAATAKSKGDK